METDAVHVHLLKPQFTECSVVNSYFVESVPRIINVQYWCVIPSLGLLALDVEYKKDILNVCNAMSDSCVQLAMFKFMKNLSFCSIIELNAYHYLARLTKRTILISYYEVVSLLLSPSLRYSRAQWHSTSNKHGIKYNKIWKESLDSSTISWRARKDRLSTRSRKEETRNFNSTKRVSMSSGKFSVKEAMMETCIDLKFHRKSSQLKKNYKYFKLSTLWDKIRRTSIVF